jgi:MazG family protein
LAEPEPGPSGSPEDAARAASGAAEVAALDEITRRLRRDCPWDRAQDERTIVPHTVEEAYELADAAHSGDDEKLLDELGDVLFQVHFLALLLEERGAGDLAAVAANTRAKLIRRHPHVFGEAEAETAGEVLTNWDRIKREQEGRQAAGPFDDVPENLPGLLYARKLQRRAKSAGLDGYAKDTEAALARVDELLGRLRDAPLGTPVEDRPDPERRATEDAIGEILLAIVDLARTAKVDPELALRRAADGIREQDG